MTCSKKRFAFITAAFVILSTLYFLSQTLCGDMCRRIIMGLPVAFLCVCGCIWGRRHPLHIVALLFSTLGDYAGEFSVPGISNIHMMIILFGIAQVHYILEFLRYRRPSHVKAVCRTYALSPVACVIYAMLLTGNVLHSCLQQRERKWMFVIGSVLFFISDSLILTRMLLPDHAFYGPAIMVTYFLAQYLLNINILACEEKN